MIGMGSFELFAMFLPGLIVPWLNFAALLYIAVKVKGISKRLSNDQVKHGAGKVRRVDSSDVVRGDDSDVA